MLIWTLLASDAPSVDPLNFIQYGILGIILFMLLTGWLWAKPAVDDMRERHEADRKLWEERILPVMERIAHGLETNNGVQAANTKEVAELTALIRDRRLS